MVITQNLANLIHQFQIGIRFEFCLIFHLTKLTLSKEEKTMSDIKALSPTISLLDSLATDYPITAIAGWMPSKKQLIEIGYPTLPNLPKGMSYLIGADFLEWQNTKCASANLYIVADADFMFEVPEKCFDHQIQAYRPDRAQIFHSGFSAVSSDQEPSPDQTVAKLISAAESLETGEEDETAEVYADGEFKISGNINRAFDLLGWNPATPCVCGKPENNNCAHYLCNALIRAGFPAPSGGSNKKCSHGRLIRALDVLEWCKKHKKAFSTGHNNLSSGTWIVFQQRSGGVQHVCIHKERSSDYSRAGTGDYPDWPTQWHYRF